MAHDLRLAETGQADRPLAVEPAEPRPEGWRVGQIDAAMSRRILLENQLFLDLQAAIAADRLQGRRVARHRMTAQRLAPFAHRSTSARPPARRSMSSGVTVSVAATSNKSARSARSG